MYDSECSTLVRQTFENFKKDKRLRFDDFLDEFMKYSKTNKRSWGRDESSIKRLKPQFKGLLLSKITVKHVEDYKRKRIEEVKPGTVNRELKTLSNIFTIAEKYGKFDGKNLVKQTKYFQVREYEMRILNREEISRLTSVSEGYLKSIVLVALNTTMRKGEILNLRWKNVDFVEHYIHIVESKTNVMRKVPMNSVVAATFKSTKRESEFVFTNPKTGTLFNDFYRKWNNARTKAGLSDVRFHDLRHTAATLMVMAGVDLVTVSQILGHKDIKMTKKYAHPTAENKRKAVNVLAAVFDEKDEKIDTIWTSVENQTSVKSLLSESKNW